MIMSYTNRFALPYTFQLFCRTLNDVKSVKAANAYFKLRIFTRQSAESRIRGRKQYLVRI